MTIEALVEYTVTTNFPVTLPYALYHLTSRWVCHTISINNRQFEIDDRIKELKGIHELLIPLLTEAQREKYKSFEIIPGFFQEVFKR